MILNLTQHISTPEQGVMEPSKEDKTRIQAILTFDSLEETTSDAMFRKAQEIGDIAVRYGAPSAMIGGALYFMTFLEVALAERGIQPMYSFTKRTVEEVSDGNGVKKTSVFKHVGWVVPQV